MGREVGKECGGGVCSRRQQPGRGDGTGSETRNAAGGQQASGEVFFSTAQAGRQAQLAGKTGWRGASSAAQQRRGDGAARRISRGSCLGWLGGARMHGARMIDGAGCWGACRGARLCAAAAAAAGCRCRARNGSSGKTRDGRDVPACGCQGEKSGSERAARQAQGQAEQRLQALPARAPSPRRAAWAAKAEQRRELSNQILPPRLLRGGVTPMVVGTERTAGALAESGC